MEETNQIDFQDKYIRLYADFENYKKRTLKEKQEIKTATKANCLETILEVHNDMAIAIRKTKMDEGGNLIFKKLEKTLDENGVNTIQIESYDPDVHEVVAQLNPDSKNIIDVVSMGYEIDGKIVRYPKVILG